MPTRHDVDGRGKSIALVVAQFNADVTAELVAGARAALLEAGVAEDDLTVYEVAGAFELAPACRQVLGAAPEIDAIVALGAVIRGETPHFEFVAGVATQALQALAVDASVPVVFGVLTTDTREQALERARPGHGDKGGEAARTALVQAALYDRLRDGRPAVRGFRIR